MTHHSLVSITVNGDKKELPVHTLEDLATHFGLKSSTLVAEVNGVIIEASRFDTPLNDGDVIELISFVGGG